MNNFKYIIYDTVETPQRFPVQKLIKSILEIFQSDFKEIRLFRCWGYGTDIAKLENILDSVEFITIPFDEFYKLAEGETQWFYDFIAKLKNDQIEIEFGLHDSSFLYVNSSREIGNDLNIFFLKSKRIEK